MRASSRILEKMLDGLVPGATLDRNELDGVKPPRDNRCETEGGDARHAVGEAAAGRPRRFRRSETAGEGRQPFKKLSVSVEAK